MPDQPISSGPAAFMDVPPLESLISTHQLISESSRRGSTNSHHGIGNILDLFHRDLQADELDFIDTIPNEVTSLRPQDLRNPYSQPHYQQQQQVPFDSSDINSAYSGRDSLATLRRLKSHSTLHHALSHHGTLPPSFTTFPTELRTLSSFSLPLTITFLLQYSLNVASVFSVGQIGSTELAAVSLAGMTANITGYCLFQGTSTSLDTLCPQAYGRGDFRMVGLHFMRCTAFLLVIMIPVVGIWVFLSNPILAALVNDGDLVTLAVSYLRVSSIGLPGFILFETLKRYLQAQNIFHASTYVILIAAPLNAVLNWFLVWHTQLGFIGAPIAIVCTNYTMSGFLLLYTLRWSDAKCWPGVTGEVLSNWGRMVELSISGCIGVLSEWLAFEVLTLSAARFGTDVLAAQSVIATICVLAYQIPFAVSIAAATRVANYIGSASRQGALDATYAALTIAFMIGSVNCFALTWFKFDIVALFTSEPEVVKLAGKIIPIGAFYQVSDSVAAVSGGILRGQGRQRLVAAVGIVSYYVIALPIGFVCAFWFQLELFGLWCGFIVGIVLISLIQLCCVWVTDWDNVIDDSLKDALAEGGYDFGEGDLRSVVSSRLSISHTH